MLRSKPLILNHQRHTKSHAFPTRRSSDLSAEVAPAKARRNSGPSESPRRASSAVAASRTAKSSDPRSPSHCRTCSAVAAGRSEEHTSELQSHSDLVCRLLLEKKKKQHPIK